MSIKPSYLSKEEFQFFDSQFKECCKQTKGEYITFEAFHQILYGNKKINKDFLDDNMNKIKAKLEKSNFLGEKIIIKENDYYKFIESILREQNTMLNENDPEMQKLFDLLSKGKETINKKDLIDIIQFYELDININDFFAHLANSTSLEFLDFCSLFKVRDGITTQTIKTFYSTFMGLREEHERKNVITDIFPIKYTPH